MLDTSRLVGFFSLLRNFMANKKVPFPKMAAIFMSKYRNGFQIDFLNISALMHSDVYILVLCFV